MSTTHGLSGSLEHRIWKGMLARCRNSSTTAYPYYGARGIKVCERWHSFVNFLADMGPAPSPEHEIDRFPNKDGDYEPGNCRWATASEQMRNTRRGRFLEYEGRRLHLKEWAEATGLSANVIGWRLKSGWSAARALTTPLQLHGKGGH